MPKVRVTLRCTACAHIYKRIIADINASDPPCPNCKKAQKVKKADWSDGRAPGIGGNNVMNKAIDETAKITMEDYKMTDLHDINLRPGDSMAPKLAPRLQAQADSFFGGPKRGQSTAGINTAQIARNAMAGRYNVGTPNPVEGMHRARVKPNISIIASTDRK